MSLVIACATEPPSTPVTITLLTASAPAAGCDAALAQGRLVADPAAGLVLTSSTGEVTRVLWPFGYSARVTDGVIELLDPGGAVIAMEGDVVEMGGGFGRGGLFYACSGTVRRVSA